MSIRHTLLTMILATAVAAGCSAHSGADASSLVDIGAGLHGPRGLRASVFATGLTHAAAFAIDREDRLWVATADYSDTGRDGVYLVPSAGAAPVEVIRDLRTPLGLLWYRGSLFVASKGRVDAYSGLHGTTFAARRTVVSLPENVGEVNNLVLAPDGDMLLGISAPCDHCAPVSKYSGSIISFRPDGSHLALYARGIRAPVGLTYVPRTSDLLATMDYRDDLGAATPGDVLALVRASSDWKNPRCYGQGGSACAGVPTAVAVLDPHAAVSGVAIVTGELGTRIGTSAFVAEWALGKVQRVALTRSGATYTGAVTPFLTGIGHPVALALASTPGAAHSALFAGDWTTGTIYRITTA